MATTTPNAVVARAGTGFHQHSGTAVETCHDVSALMDFADTGYRKFAPDVGQLQNAGARVKVTKAGRRPVA